MIPARLLAPVIAVFLLAAAPGCDRNVEPYRPGEEPRPPDLSKIFPEGAALAAQQRQQAAPGGGMPPAPAEVPGGAAAASSAAPVRGTVTVAPELADRVPQGAVLFVIARRHGGGGPPLAVKRVPSPELPFAFEIGPGDRMIANMPFAGPIELTARLDADGNATTREPGDLQGAAGAPVEPGATGVVIVLDQVL